MARKTKQPERRPRAFARDASIGFRLPGDDRARLWELARKKVRDPSCLIREWVREGLKKAERELEANPA